MVLLDIYDFMIPEEGILDHAKIHSFIKENQFTQNNTKFLTYFNKETYVSNVTNLNKILHSDEHFSIRGTNKEIGSGLGLILVKEFIEYHNSKLNIISEKDKGSEFSFELNLF